MSKIFILSLLLPFSLFISGGQSKTKTDSAAVVAGSKADRLNPQLVAAYVQIPQRRK